MRWTLGLALLAGAPGALAQQSPRKASNTFWKEVVAKFGRATVTVSAQRRDGASAFGSGFLVSPDGVIATAAHVVNRAGSACIRFAGGETFEVRGLLAFDAARDFALLRIAGFGLPAVTLGNSDSVEIGAHLTAFGAPFGYEGTISDGLLSGVRVMDGTRLFQVSIPVSGGSSGGPVVDDQGRVVGMVVSLQAGAQDLGFALPINYLRGEIALPLGKTPIPLAQATYSGGASGDEAMASGAPSHVNDSLQIDPDILDGTSSYLVETDHRGTLTTSVDYRKTVSANGAEVLERYSRGISRQSKQDRYTDEQRVEVDRHLTTIHGYYRRTSYSAGVAGFSGRLSADGGQLSVSGLGSENVNDVFIPRGIVTQDLLLPLIASLPDRLPQSVHLWVLSGDTTDMTPIPARIDFGDMDSVAVLLAHPGVLCGPRTRLHHQVVPVIAVTLTIGPSKEEFPILASRPHVRVDDVLEKAPSDRVVKRCLSLPQVP